MNQLEVYAPWIKVLGVRVHSIQIPSVIAKMEDWIPRRNGSRFISVTNVHSIMEARSDPLFRKVLQSADLSVPDGMPLVWLGRLKGHKVKRRVYGPDLLWDFCRETHEKGYRHFFYGGASGVPEKLADSLRREFPGLNVVGTYSPPFRSLTPDEDAQVVKMINEAAPDVLWVGLGCPKQEYWMHAHRNKLRVPVMVGVGQAFDIYAGCLRQAPRWMRENGLEWLFRLLLEPRRLWRRYLVYNTQFVFYVLLELTGIKRFD